MNTPSYAEIRAAAFFGALWGTVEILLGTLLHAAHVPFRGVLMSCLAAALLVCAREFTRYRGSLAAIGAVAALLKGFSPAGFVLMPMLAIMMEALLAEMIFSLLGFHRMSALLMGGMLTLYSLVHGLLTQGIFFGLDIYAVYMKALAEVSSQLGIDPAHLWQAVVALAVLHGLLGALAAWFGWGVAQRTRTLLVVEAR